MMNDINARIMKYSEAPMCCKTCARLEIDGDTMLVSCSKDLRLPTKKGSCQARIGAEQFTERQQAGE